MMKALDIALERVRARPGASAVLITTLEPEDCQSGGCTVVSCGSIGQGLAALHAFVDSLVVETRAIVEGWNGKAQPDGAEDRKLFRDLEEVFRRLDAFNTDLDDRLDELGLNVVYGSREVVLPDSPSDGSKYNA